MDQTITMSTGVVFKLKPPSVWALTEIKRQMSAQMPRPPVVYIEAKMREESNESDPAYIEAVEMHSIRTMERILDTIIATGTSVELVPEGVPAIADDAWREMLTVLGIDSPAEGPGRYIAWAKYIAAPTDEDWLNLRLGTVRRAGTPEEDVAAAAASFRSDEESGADRVSAGAGKRRNGN